MFTPTIPSESVETVQRYRPIRELIPHIGSRAV